MDFYATAAQVIPTLFLAMAFESRALLRLPTSYDPGADPDDPARWNAAQIIGMLYFVALMACGELAALTALYRDAASDLTTALTWLGLVGGLLGVVLPVLGNRWRLLKQHLSSAGSWGQVLFLGFFLVCLLVLTGWVIGWFVN